MLQHLSEHGVTTIKWLVSAMCSLYNYNVLALLNECVYIRPISPIEWLVSLNTCTALNGLWMLYTNHCNMWLVSPVYTVYLYSTIEWLVIIIVYSLLYILTQLNGCVYMYMQYTTIQSTVIYLLALLNGLSVMCLYSLPFVICSSPIIVSAVYIHRSS